MSKERRFILSYAEANKKALEFALTDRLYNLKQVEKRTQKGEWNKEIEGLEQMLKQVYGIT